MKKLYLTACLTMLGAGISAQTFTNPNFSYTIISDGWVQAMGAAFTKDAQKLFVWEKAGLLYVCNKSGNTYAKQATPVLNISAEVLNWLDHGFVGFALDPNYQVNNFIYLLYAVDRRFLVNDNSITADAGFSATIARLTRYKTIMSGTNLIADPASRTILIGETKSTGIPILHESHGIGTLAFAADGTLLLSAGDAANFNNEDYGSNAETYYVQALADGIIRPQENVGSFRAQMLNSHCGKLLRVDPATGNGIPSNPFYSAIEPRAPKSRVWALGFRNPFRFIVRPGTGSTNPDAGDIGEIYLGDVGWETWEDFSIISRPGMNFGWPLYEGQALNTRYISSAASVQNLDEPNPLAGGACTRPCFTFRELLKEPTADGNTTIYNPCNPSVPIGSGLRFVHKRPALDFSHLANSSRVGIFSGNNPAIAEIGTPESGVSGTPFKGNCVVSGMWYTGNDFPAEYRDKFFLADWGGLWIKRLSIDYTDVVTRVDNFASNFKYIVCMTENPVDGTVVVVNMDFPPVGILDYGGNQPPVAKPVANVTYGPSPLTVNFTGNTSFDPSPGGSIASYSWNFGGGNPATSSASNPTNVVFADASGNPKKFVVRLTVTDNGGATHTDSVIISVNNTPPAVNITSPVKNSTYKLGIDTTYTCSATVSDAQHSGSQLKYEWQSFLRHNTHEHAGSINSSSSTSMQVSRPGCNGDSYYWLFRLKVTDAAGLSTIDSAKVFPDCNVGPDLASPEVSSVTPVNGAVSIPTNSSVTAILNEPIDPSSVNSSTYQLKDAGNNSIAATVATSANQLLLTPSSALSGLATYTVTLKGGPSGIKDLAGNAMVNDFSWSFTTAAVDNVPPTVQSVNPVNNATGVATATSITANLSEAINPSSVTTASFQLKDAGNNIVPAAVSVSSGQLTLTPSTGLVNAITYTVTIKGGAPGIKDLAGNALVDDYSWSFTTVAASSAYHIFTAADLPNSPRSNDGTGISLGVKFRASQNGFVTGVRYYRGAGTTGTHTGSLWTSTGSLLAQAVYTNETASGWQTVYFTSPVPITAGVTYISSYHSPSGDFAATGNYFTQAKINGPLRALANGEDGVNGLYRYTSSPQFPNNGYQSSNYWADVVFTSTAGGFPSVSLHPSSQSVCAGSSAIFNSVANGSPAPSVQWQESTNGTTWTNISGATSGTLTVNATSALNNRQYRANWSNSTGSISSNPATLTVKIIPAAPGVSVTNNCSSSLLTATGFTGSLLWSNTATSSSITVTSAGVYSVTQTVNGCTSPAGSGTAAPKAIPAAPIVSVTNNCGNSVLTASGFTGSLLWNNGATAVSITVTTGGTYTVTQTVNGCTSPAGSGLAQPITSTVPAPSVAVTNNCGSSTLTATGYSGSLLWSNGATTASINVSSSGTYTVTQTVNGCTSPGGSGTALPKVIPVLSSNLSGTGTSGSVFNYAPTSSTPGTSFSWSRAAVAGVSNPAATGTGNISETLVNTGSSPVNVVYVYTLTANGCSNTQNLTVTVNPAQGVICSRNVSITSSFNSSSIPAGRYIWFSSVFDRGSFTGISGTVIFTITNNVITFTANGQPYTLTVPDARVRFDAAVTSASTQFINGAWETAVPRSYSSYVFMTGLSYQVPVSLPGNISNVRWTATIGVNKTGVSLAWRWAAATYTSFAGHTGLNVKPVNGSSQNPYPNSNNAGTPENYKAYLIRGAKSSGGSNYTGSYTGTSTGTCTPVSGQRSTGQWLQVQSPVNVPEADTDDLTVTIMPNPSHHFFHVTVTTNDNDPVMMRVFDLVGRERERHEKIAPGTAKRIGQNWPGGVYIMEIIQNRRRKFVKLIKAN